MNAFGQRLRELREASGMSQKELSDKSGVGYGIIRDLEQGIRKGGPSYEDVTRLADALGTDCNAFRATEGDEPAGKHPPAPRGRPRKAQPRKDAGESGK